MCVASISRAVSFCSHSQTGRCSCILKTTAAALGVIALLIGILAVSGIPALHAIGTTGGWVLTTVGALLILTALCLQCIKKKTPVDQSRGRQSSIRDPRVSSITSSTGSSYDPATGITTTHCESYFPLKKFLISNSENDTAIIHELKIELAIEDLTSRLIENFSTDHVDLALTLKYVNDIRDDNYLLKMLKLIYLSDVEILSLSLENVANYDDDLRNILCLRLMRIKDCSATFEEGTLGAFRVERGSILQMTVTPQSYYLFFTKEQLIFFLDNKKELKYETAKVLFPSNPCFIRARSRRLLKELPIESVNKIILHLDSLLLFSLILDRDAELNYDLISKKQIKDMFPTESVLKERSRIKMGRLSVSAIHHLLPKMDSSIQELIPKNRLKNKIFNLLAPTID